MYHIFFIYLLKKSTGEWFVIEEAFHQSMEQVRVLLNVIEYTYGFLNYVLLQITRFFLHSYILTTEKKSQKQSSWLLEFRIFGPS